MSNPPMHVFSFYFSFRAAEAGAEAMASKADRLKQKALSVVDTVQTLSSSTDSSNSCTITVKVGGVGC